MKNHVELAYLLLLLIALLLNPPAVSNFKKTVLGKMVLVVGVVMMALCNKVYGLIAAFLTVCLLQNVREGMTHKEGEEESEGDEEGDEEEDEEEDEQENDDGEKENMKHNMSQEKQEQEEEDEEHEEGEEEPAEENEGKEGFTLFSKSSAFQTSSMDRLAADEMLKSKPSHMFPVNDVERRGQDKSVVDSVFSSVRKLFG